MEYEPNFAKDFMRRTIEIVRDYNGPHDATIVVNCLVGLLIVPKESQLIKKVPKIPFKDLSDWGIYPGTIKEFGKCDYGQKHEPDLQQFMRRLRNAVAHFRINPIHEDRMVKGYIFKDSNGFEAHITISEMRHFVTKIAAHIENHA